jgi:TonB family protein
VRIWLYAIVGAAACHAAPPRDAGDAAALAGIHCEDLASAGRAGALSPVDGAPWTRVTSDDLDRQRLDGHGWHDHTILAEEDDLHWVSPGESSSAVVEICVDEQGAVAEITAVRPSPLSSWNRRVCEHVRGWRFRPFVVDGAPHKVCAPYTFAFERVRERPRLW